MDNSISNENPFNKIDPLRKEEKQKDIFLEFKKYISSIKDKQKLLDINNLLTHQLKSM